MSGWGKADSGGLASGLVAQISSFGQRGMAAALGLLPWRADLRRSVACRGELAERLLLEDMMDGMKVVAGARDTEMDLRTPRRLNCQDL